MRATIRGLHQEMPGVRCHRVVSAGRVTLHVTSNDHTRSVVFELTPADLADIESELGLAGASITIGDLAACDKPTAVIAVPTIRELPDCPGCVLPVELGGEGG